MGVQVNVNLGIQKKWPLIFGLYPQNNRLMLKF